MIDLPVKRDARSNEILTYDILKHSIGACNLNAIRFNSESFKILIGAIDFHDVTNFEKIDSPRVELFE